MSQYEARIEALEADRRRTARFTVECSAIFRTVSGDRRGTMENVSELGARFATKRPPVQGVTGLLPQRRAETLSVGEFTALARAIG